MNTYLRAEHTSVKRPTTPRCAGASAGRKAADDGRAGGRNRPGGARGDLHVKILVDVPDQLDAGQRAAVEALARTLGPEAHPRRRAWDAYLRGSSP
jgi:DnaJ-class molecular chaperone